MGADEERVTAAGRGAGATQAAATIRFSCAVCQQHSTSTAQIGRWHIHSHAENAVTRRGAVSRVGQALTPMRLPTPPASSTRLTLLSGMVAPLPCAQTMAKQVCVPCTSKWQQQWWRRQRRQWRGRTCSARQTRGLRAAAACRADRRSCRQLSRAAGVQPLHRWATAGRAATRAAAAGARTVPDAFALQNVAREAIVLAVLGPAAGALELILQAAGQLCLDANPDTRDQQPKLGAPHRQQMRRSARSAGSGGAGRPKFGAAMRGLSAVQAGVASKDAM